MGTKEVDFTRMILESKSTIYTVLLPFLGVNLFTTIRMHNSVIGAYEGLLFDDPDVSETLRRTYYSEEAITERRHRTAKRKYIMCIVIIFVILSRANNRICTTNITHPLP